MISFFFRFVILALVPRDLLHQLPVPKRIRTYLDTPFYYSETIADWTVPGNEPVSSNLSKDECNDETEVMFSNRPSLHSPIPSITSSREENPSSNPVLNEQEGNSTDANHTYQTEPSRNSENSVVSSEIVPNLATSSPQQFLHNNRGEESAAENNAHLSQSSNPS